MFKCIILCFIIFKVSTAAVCPGSTTTAALQNTILSMHNGFRSELAKGLSTIKGGAMASAAKNMYRLNYDCALEASAQKQANKCVFEHTPSAELLAANTGENLFGTMPSGPDVQSSLTTALNGWWGELASIGGITPTDVKLTMARFSSGLGHWTQMAWGKTTAVACVVKICPSMNFVVCHYKEAGNVLNADIYERGTACSADADCTTYANSKCDLTTKLCYTGETVTVAPATTTKATTTAAASLGWTEWAASSCTANCGLCGRAVMRRVCRSGTCPGANTMASTTRCGASSLCPFGLGLPSCCAPAKRVIVNGNLSCA